MECDHLREVSYYLLNMYYQINSHWQIEFTYMKVKNLKVFLCWLSLNYKYILNRLSAARTSSGHYLEYSYVFDHLQVLL